jgi:hypothetical protein
MKDSMFNKVRRKDFLCFACTRTYAVARSVVDLASRESIRKCIKGLYGVFFSQNSFKIGHDAELRNAKNVAFVARESDVKLKIVVNLYVFISQIIVADRSHRESFSGRIPAATLPVSKNCAIVNGKFQSTLRHPKLPFVILNSAGIWTIGRFVGNRFLLLVFI